jgi:hypothetical protein
MFCVDGPACVRMCSPISYLFLLVSLLFTFSSLATLFPLSSCPSPSSYLPLFFLPPFISSYRFLSSDQTPSCFSSCQPFLISVLLIIVLCLCLLSLNSGISCTFFVVSTRTVKQRMNGSVYTLLSTLVVLASKLCTQLVFGLHWGWLGNNDLRL